MDNILELKTINDLRKMNFFIPSYQRGYRWGEKEVSDLLNDIEVVKFLVEIFSVALIFFSRYPDS